MIISEKICTFEVEGKIFGAEVETVQEVISRINIFSVSNLPELYLGLLNLRGLVIPIMKLHEKFKTTNKAVVLRYQDKTISINVEKFGDVISICSEERGSFIYETNSSEQNHFILGKIKTKDDKIINLIDINKVFNF